MCKASEARGTTGLITELEGVQEELRAMTLPAPPSYTHSLPGTSPQEPSQSEAQGPRAIPHQEDTCCSTSGPSRHSILSAGTSFRPPGRRA